MYWYTWLSIYFFMIRFESRVASRQAHGLDAKERRKHCISGVKQGSIPLRSSSSGRFHTGARFESVFFYFNTFDGLVN